MCMRPECRAAIPSDWPQADKDLAALALDGMTAYYAEEVGVPVFDAATRAILRLGLDLDAYRELAMQRARTQREVDAMRAARSARETRRAA